ncbi:MAG: hypothetical protein JNK82_20100 [Myxococcaceae bacterium]|nr:hypothetical protein [Myxococcaceae bacterium]
MLRLAASVAAVTLALFFWSGLSQQLPWGVPTVKNVVATTGPVSDFAGTANLVMLPPGALTTPRFDTELGRGISTLTTEGTFAWVMSIDRAGYDPLRYLALELVSQLGVAMFIVVVMWQLRQLAASRRVGVVASMALCASTATWSVLANWWGVPPLFAAGMSLNLIVGWVLGATLSATLMRSASTQSPS